MAHGRGRQPCEDRAGQTAGGAAQVHRVDDGGGAGHGVAVTVGPGPRVGPVEVGGNRDDGSGAGELLLHGHALDLLRVRQVAHEVGAVGPHPVDAWSGTARPQEQDEGLECDGGGVPAPGLGVLDQGGPHTRQERSGVQRLGRVVGGRRAPLEGPPHIVAVGAILLQDGGIEGLAAQWPARASRGQAVGGGRGVGIGEAVDDLAQDLVVSAHDDLPRPPGRRFPGR